MKALVLTAYKEFEVTTCPSRPSAPSDVLVRVEACGICGSDVHGMDGSTGRRRPPIVMGHEASGVDREAGRRGAAATSSATGSPSTRPSTTPTASSRSAGMINLCDDRRVLGVSLRGLPAARRLRRAGGRAPAHPLRAAAGHDLRAGGAGRAGVHRRARPQPDAHRAGRHRAGVRRRPDRPDDGAGAEAHRRSSRSSPSTSTTASWQVAREVGAHHVLNSQQGRRGGGGQGADRRPRRRRRLRGGGHRGHRARGHRERAQGRHGHPGGQPGQGRVDPAAAGGHPADPAAGLVRLGGRVPRVPGADRLGQGERRSLHLGDRAAGGRRAAGSTACTSASPA